MSLKEAASVAISSWPCAAFFFFQAEDGIRYKLVTGVQTCALPICTDGEKMSKSRGNAIALAATADETAQLIRAAKTDAQRHISYEPRSRPEVSSLVLLAALCQGRDPAEVAAEIGAGGSAKLKRVVTQAVNEYLRPIRARRAELAGDSGFLRQVLREGNARANAVASRTLTEVHALMGTGPR